MNLTRKSLLDNLDLDIIKSENSKKVLLWRNRSSWNSSLLMEIFHIVEDVFVLETKILEVLSTWDGKDLIDFMKIKRSDGLSIINTTVIYDRIACIDYAMSYGSPKV